MNLTDLTVTVSESQLEALGRIAQDLGIEDPSQMLELFVADVEKAERDGDGDEAVAIAEWVGLHSES